MCVLFFAANDAMLMHQKFCVVMSKCLVPNLQTEVVPKLYSTWVSRRVLRKSLHLAKDNNVKWTKTNFAS